VGLSLEITLIAEADVLSTAEGNTVARIPGTGQRALRAAARRGQRPGHAHKGSPGTWEVPTPSSQDETAERSASEQSRGAGKSECRSTSREAGEPSRGTLRSKGRHRNTEP
jgi:hypothetical protein